MRTEGINIVVDKSPSNYFLEKVGKLRNLTSSVVSKKLLKGQYQLYFEFVNKVLLLQIEKRIIATIDDLYLIEKLSSLVEINLPALMMEHMTKIYNMVEGKHGLSYGYLLNHMFE